MYTHGHHDVVLQSHSQRTVANSAAYLRPHLRPEQSLLDVGCGPGTITADLADLVGHVTAVEPVSTSLDSARQHAHGRSNITFETADVHNLPYDDNSFDVVHAHQVLQHVHSPVAALREMRRVSRDLVAARDSDYAAFTWYPSSPGLDDWLALYRRVARRNGGEPDAGRRLKSWALEAGFTEVTAYASVWSWSTPEERESWGGMWADRILKTAIADQAVEYGYATRADLERVSRAWRSWVTAEDGWFAVLHGEILCRG
jgi:SAM-dependent methyltransferase